MRSRVVLALLGTVLSFALTPVATGFVQSAASDGGGSAPAQKISHHKPPAGGYFKTRPPGSWRTLPGDKACANRVHQSTWEPRPLNHKRNNIMPPVRQVHHALAIRPRNVHHSYSRHWDHWLMQRVDGHDTGTTDEIFQWAACKWGISDNLLRSVAMRESTWYQYPTYKSGKCVTDWGCGDFITHATKATHRYCNGIARFGYDYQNDYGSGLCPETFSIMGVMSWEAPSWGRMAGNQHGTFPFSRNSTAFSVDYAAAYLRGCDEGWVFWMKDSGTGTYGPGKMWGCVGSWYSGSWHDPGANTYIKHVKREMRAHRWLRPVWPTIHPPCTAHDGCPVQDPLPTT